MAFEILKTLFLSNIADVRPFKDDWLVVLQVPQEELPNRVELRMYDSSGDGEKIFDLKNRPIWWDIEEDIFILDEKGLYNLSSSTYLFKESSLLGSHTIAQPQRVDFMHGDFLFIPKSGGLDIVSRSGGLRQSIPLNQISALGSSQKKGGLELRFSSRTQPFVIGDWDGDGDKDILVLNAESGVLWLQKDESFVYQGEIKLPLNLFPIKSRAKKRTELDEVWFKDFNNDGLLDLGWSLWSVNGSWLDSSSKMMYSIQNDGQLGSKKIRPAKGSVFDSRWLDLDGDGDLDLISLEANLGWASLSRAFLTKKSTARLMWYPMDGVLKEPILIKELVANIEDPSALYYSFHDFNQDGWLDLITNQSTKELQLYLSQKGEFSKLASMLSLDFTPKCKHSQNASYCWGQKKSVFLRWNP